MITYLDKKKPLHLTKQKIFPIKKISHWEDLSKITTNKNFLCQFRLSFSIFFSSILFLMATQMYKKGFHIMCRITLRIRRFYCLSSWIKQTILPLIFCSENFLCHTSRISDLFLVSWNLNSLFSDHFICNRYGNINSNIVLRYLKWKSTEYVSVVKLACLFL